MLNPGQVQSAAGRRPSATSWLRLHVARVKLLTCLVSSCSPARSEKEEIVCADSWCMLRLISVAHCVSSISGVMTGESTFNVVLQRNDVAVAHASTYFTVVEGHGRFFGSNLTTIVDGHGTAAFFRAPANRSTVAWAPSGITLQLLAQNFLPGQSYTFQIVADAARDDVVEAERHEVTMRLGVGVQCLTLVAINTETGRAVGEADRLCLRVVPPETVAMGGGPPADCGAFNEAVAGEASPGRRRACRASSCLSCISVWV